MNSDSEKIFLAIDLGASNGRVIIGSLIGKKLKLKVAYRFEHEIVELDGAKNWNLEHILRKISEGLEKACEMTGDKAVASISCDSWAQDFVMLDARGEACIKPVSYRDRRTAGMPQSFAKIISLEELHCRNGSSIASITTLCQLKAMSDNGSIPKSAVNLLHIAPYINFFYGGGAIGDWTMASASQVWNIRKDGWDLDLLSKLGIAYNYFPEVLKNPAVVGRVNADRAPHPKLSGVPVSGGAGHDTAVAMTVTYPFRKDTLFLSLGTWVMLGRYGGADFDPEKFEKDDITAGYLGLPFGEWGVFHGGAGMWPLQQCRREWLNAGIPVTWDELEIMAEKSRVEDYFDLTDERIFAPERMSAAIDEICTGFGIALPRCPGDYVRLIYNSLSEKINRDIRAMRESTGIDFKEICIAGGGSRNDLLCGIIETKTGIRVSRGPIEATAIGNILMQAIATGAIAATDIPGILEDINENGL